jgi:hypothetical protein
MAGRRFAGPLSGAVAVLINRIVIAIVAAVAAASLTACGTGPRPLSVEEHLGFDKATGADITDVPPGLRMHGYPHPFDRTLRVRPPDEP